MNPLTVIILAWKEGVELQEVAEINRAKNFACAINECLNVKRWSPIKLCAHVNVLTNEDLINQRTLQYWLSGQGLPKIEAVVVMAEALGMPELIEKRVQLVKDMYKKEKARCQ